jgi:transposase-like protein
MPLPTHCSNPQCANYRNPPPRWFHRFGSYSTIAHGDVPRFRCTRCGRTLSCQTESVHYYAKRRLPLQQIHTSLLGGSSQRDLARRYHCSPMAIQNAVLRLGRQAMGYQAILCSHLNPRNRIVFDGLRSFVTSQDYPCDLTTTVDAAGETILTITHAVFRRGGTMTPVQRRRMNRKDARWRPPPGEVKRAIHLTCRELWDYLRPEFTRTALIDTDENPMYRSVLRQDAVMGHFRSSKMVRHRRTPGSAPRTMANPLFPANYVDRLLRHRMKEHTRETIAFGRHATMQMCRAWLFAWDHNSRREYRVRRPEEGVHLGQGSVSAAGCRQIARLNRSFFTRRVDLAETAVADSIRRVWLNELTTPPVRWRVGQKGTSVRVPAFARRDLDRGSTGW